jgi:hypothetical protein
MGVAREESQEARGHAVLALGPLLFDEPDEPAPLGLSHPEPAPHAGADLAGQEQESVSHKAVIAAQRLHTHARTHLGADEKKPAECSARVAGEVSSLVLSLPPHLLHRSGHLLHGVRARVRHRVSEIKRRIQG